VKSISHFFNLMMM